MLPVTTSMIAPMEPWLSNSTKESQFEITKYCKAAMNNKTPPQVFQMFADQAQSIDTSWSLPERTTAALKESKKNTKQQVIQAKKNAGKLRQKFLKQKVAEQVSCIDEKKCGNYIQRIKKIEEMQNKHRIIKSRLK